ncbi:MAG: hypothetical protein PUF16_00895 [Lachnospiraceae bacterium]|nr:hypothetical protein [Lachnospiraceae bacterium]
MFLYRAPKINLAPLNMAAIAKKYQQVFDLPNEKSAEMSQLTLGYSFALPRFANFVKERSMFYEI